MEYQDLNQISDFIKRLLRYIDYYLSRGSTLLDSRDISKTLEELSKLESAPKLFIENTEIGIRTFKKLRKYLSAHLSRLDIKLDNLLIYYAMPLILSKEAFNAFFTGKAKSLVLAKVPGMTKNYIKNAFKQLKRISEVSEKARISKIKVQREFLRIREIDLLIETEKKKLKTQYEKLSSLFSRKLDSFEAIEMVSNISRRELILKLLAYIDHTSKEDQHVNESR